MTRPSLILLAIPVALAAGQSRQDLRQDPPRQDPRQDAWIGRWRSTEVTPAGVSAIFELHSDSQLDSYSAAITDGKYRLIGTDTILLQSKGGEEKEELEWDNQDRGRIEDEAAGKSMELTRLGKIADSKNPLLGGVVHHARVERKELPGSRFVFSRRKIHLDRHSTGRSRALLRAERQYPVGNRGPPSGGGRVQHHRRALGASESRGWQVQLCAVLKTLIHASVNVLTPRLDRLWQPLKFRGLRQKEVQE